MTRDLFLKYAELKTEITELERQLKDLQPMLLKEFAAVDDKGVNLEGIGVFTVVHRKNWKYSPVVDDLKVKFDKQRVTEEADGTATFEEVRGVMFRAIA